MYCTWLKNILKIHTSALNNASTGRWSEVKSSALVYCNSCSLGPLYKIRSVQAGILCFSLPIYQSKLLSQISSLQERCEKHTLCHIDQFPSHTCMLAERLWYLPYSLGTLYFPPFVVGARSRLAFGQYSTRNPQFQILNTWSASKSDARSSRFR